MKPHNKFIFDIILQYTTFRRKGTLRNEDGKISNYMYFSKELYVDYLKYSKVIQIYRYGYGLPYKYIFIKENQLWKTQFEDEIYQEITK